MLAVNEQVRRDFAPIWQTYGVVYAGRDLAGAPDHAWKIVVRDQPGPQDQGFLGEHDTTAGGNVPRGMVFAQFSEQHGSPWSSVLSHEVLEMLGDPWVNRYVMHAPARGAPQMWYQEVCDPVQGDLYEDPQLGVQLSDFVLPNYFTDGAHGPYDFRNLLKRPFEIRAGGYAGYLQLAAGKLTEKQVFGASYPEWRKRTALRKTARHDKALAWAAPDNPKEEALA